MQFAEPLKVKITEGGKVRLSVKVTDEVIVTRDIPLDSFKSFLAQAQAAVKEHENK